MRRRGVKGSARILILCSWLVGPDYVRNRQFGGGLLAISGGRSPDLVLDSRQNTLESHPSSSGRLVPDNPLQAKQVALQADKG